MPIKACADKLKREMEMFGPDFSGYKGAYTLTTDVIDANSFSSPYLTPYVDESAEEEVPVDDKDAAATDPTKVVRVKGKVAAKSTGLKYQFQIMQTMGVPTSEIAAFADAKHWLYYFPPLAQQDLKSMGVHVDWRRSL